jgi:hypothetical protein
VPAKVNVGVYPTRHNGQAAQVDYDLRGLRVNRDYLRALDDDARVTNHAPLPSNRTPAAITTRRARAFVRVEPARGQPATSTHSMNRLTGAARTV